MIQKLNYYFKIIIIIIYKFFMAIVFELLNYIFLKLL